MSAIDQMKMFWPDYTVEKKVGSGSFGDVYRVSRNIGNKTFYSAVKVITIPQSEEEIDAIRAEANEEQSTRQYFHDIVDDYVSEIAVMMDLRGSSNIVAVEDYKVFEHTDRICWDIYIRMEYLTCLKELMINKTFTEKEVCRLGSDLCNALICCEKHQIIHRDIKPGNIFLSSDGDFKLGDFGTARSISRTQSVLSQKGTFDYMAPEMISMQRYDATVDTYALGIVLYKLLNNNRGPFLDPNVEYIRANEKEQALAARLSGREFTPPANASADMFEIIRTACRFNPAQRYSSPSFMKEQLDAVLNGKPIRAAFESRPDEHRFAEYDTTETEAIRPDVNYFNGPAMPGNMMNPNGQYRNYYGPGMPYQNQPVNSYTQPGNNPYANDGKDKGKKKKILIPVVLVSCILLFIVGFFSGSLLDKVEDVGPDKEEDSVITESNTEQTISTETENAGKNTAAVEEKSVTATPMPTPTPTPTPTPVMTEASASVSEAASDADVQVLDDAVLNTDGSASSVDNIVYIADVYEFMTLREAPSTSAKAICLLPPYTAMYITEMTNDTMVRVVTVDYGYTGYVNRNYLAMQGTVTQRAGKTPKETVTTSDPIYYADVYNYLTLRDAPSTSASEKNRLLPFTAMYVHSRTNGMAYVTVVETGETGYVNCDYITSDPNSTVRAGRSQSITTTKHGFSVGDYCFADVNEYLTLRNAPSTSAGEITRLPDDTMMVILEHTNDTMMKVQVIPTGEVGYVNKEYVK